MITKDVIKLIIKRTLHVPNMAPSEDFVLDVAEGTRRAIQLDNALISAGFKMDSALFHQITCGYCQPPLIIEAIKELVGDHVKHNVYFKKFPKDVPDTFEFWGGLVIKALYGEDTETRDKVLADLNTGGLNLLNLPGYGTYGHSYEDLMAITEAFVASSNDRLTIIRLGGTFKEEVDRLFLLLANSSVPLSETDREILGELAAISKAEPTVKIRENLAIINKVRCASDKPIVIETLTDVIRFCAAFSDGDPTLAESTKFKSMPRSLRREILANIERLIVENPNRLSDVNQYREIWKRLGERLHPGESKCEEAKRVFAVAHGEELAPSINSRLEAAFAAKNIHDVLEVAGQVPGVYIRSLDRIVSLNSTEAYAKMFWPEIWDKLEGAVKSVSTRVLLSARQHFMNRDKGLLRIFINSKGGSHPEKETREPMAVAVIDRILQVIDQELESRLTKTIAINPEAMGIAIPISEKGKTDGFGILPRGSVTPITGDRLRFFTYWKQAAERTDFDLSAILLDDKFNQVDQLSYTRLTSVGGVHSGDITSAPDGASEFIELDLSKVTAKYIVPQVHVYSGEGFGQVEESFFGYMERDGEQKGAPFDARTVRVKSDLRGASRTLLPLVFINEDGVWKAKWLHLSMRGYGWGNATETSGLSTAALARAIVEKDYLTLGYLAGLSKPGSDIKVSLNDGDITPLDLIEVVSLMEKEA